MKKISAIIPAYNAERYLERAVISLIETDYPDLEIIIVDDGSSDSTWKVAGRLDLIHPQVRLFRHDDGKNHGVSAARNLGLAECSGELICFLDADDYVFPNRFVIAPEILSSEPAVDAVYETSAMVYENHKIFHKNERQAHSFGLAQEMNCDDLLRTLLKGNVWSVSAILIRRKLLDETGLFDESLHIAEDCNLWFRMAAIGSVVAGDLHRPVSAYVRHGENAYQPVTENKISMFSAMVIAHKWALSYKVSGATLTIFETEIENFYHQSIIVAREEGNNELAWRVFWVALRERRWRLAFGIRSLRQFFAVFRADIFSR